MTKKDNFSESRRGEKSYLYIIKKLSFLISAPSRPGGGGLGFRHQQRHMVGRLALRCHRQRSLWSPEGPLVMVTASWEWMEDGGLHIFVYRKFRNVAGSGARRKPGQSGHIEIIGSLQFGNGWRTEGSTYPCIGNPGMWLTRAPDGSPANPDA